MLTEEHVKYGKSRQALKHSFSDDVQVSLMTWPTSRFDAYLRVVEIVGSLSEPEKWHRSLEVKYKKEIQNQYCFYTNSKKVVNKKMQRWFNATLTPNGMDYR